jgi:hypothetical protein
MDKLITDSVSRRNFQTSRRNSTCPMHRRLAERTQLPTSKLCRTSLESLQKEHTMVHELAQHPANIWLLTGEWIADVMNHTAEKSLQWRPPLEVLTGQTVDISILLCFLFWDVVYVTRYDDTQYKGQVGSNKSSEIRGRFVGFSHHVGHALTFKILTDDTRHIIHRSRVRLPRMGEQPQT